MKSKAKLVTLIFVAVTVFALISIPPTGWSAIVNTKVAAEDSVPKVLIELTSAVYVPTGKNPKSQLLISTILFIT